ncbi:MAG: hypothetical protein ACEPOZ_01145 [Marinifilaceae bacterium]
MPLPIGLMRFPCHPMRYPICFVRLCHKSVRYHSDAARYPFECMRYPHSPMLFEREGVSCRGDDPIFAGEMFKQAVLREEERAELLKLKGNRVGSEVGGCLCKEYAMGNRAGLWLTKQGWSRGESPSFCLKLQRRED